MECCVWGNRIETDRFRIQLPIPAVACNKEARSGLVTYRILQSGPQVLDCGEWLPLTIADISLCEIVSCCEIFIEPFMPVLLALNGITKEGI
jgi:hypothetical protein